MSATESAAVSVNRALGRRFFEEQDRLQGGPAESLCSPDYQASIGSNPPVDRVGHEFFAKAFYGAFPGISHSVQEIFATEDRVAARFVLNGTHNGPFFGIPPTGKTVSIPVNILLHVADGKVTKLFGVFDEAGMLRQMGVLPR